MPFLTFCCLRRKTGRVQTQSTALGSISMLMLHKFCSLLFGTPYHHCTNNRLPTLKGNIVHTFLFCKPTINDKKRKKAAQLRPCLERKQCGFMPYRLPFSLSMMPLEKASVSDSGLKTEWKRIQNTHTSVQHFLHPDTCTWQCNAHNLRHQRIHITLFTCRRKSGSQRGQNRCLGTHPSRCHF